MEIKEEHIGAHIDANISHFAQALMKVKFLAEGCADDDDQIRDFYNRYRRRFREVAGDEAINVLNGLTADNQGKFGKSLQELSNVSPMPKTQPAPPLPKGAIRDTSVKATSTVDIEDE